MRDRTHVGIGAEGGAAKRPGAKCVGLREGCRASAGLEDCGASAGNQERDESEDGELHFESWCDEATW